MKTTVEELEGSKVRLDVEVPEDAVEHAFDHAARDLAAELRVPGFRKGRVPVRVAVARIGTEAVWAEAIRGHIDGWFWDAATTSGVRPIAGPEVEWDELPEQGGTFRFRATVPVAPKPELADWTELEVPRPEPEVPDEVLEVELERVRASVAELVPLTGRPVAVGDTVVVDVLAAQQDSEDSEFRDYVAELGTGQLADEIEEVLPEMQEGESRTVEIAVPEGQASVTVTLKEAKEKILPELDDELARNASEFETLDELRADLEERLREQLEAELDAHFRQDALDALVAASTVTGYEPLAERRAASLLGGFVRSLQARGIELEAYLAMTGQTEEALREGARAEAERSVLREIVLEAVADRLGIVVPDDEVEELVRQEATESGEDPDAMLSGLRDGGGFEQLRADLRLRKAMDEVAGGVKRISVDLARAREKLWTPEKEKGGTGMKIWTPGSEEETPR